MESLSGGSFDPPLSVSKNHPAQQCPSLLLEEKVSPVHTLVTDVVENVTISPAVWYKAQHFAVHHISQKSVPKCRFLPASPRGEAFFPVLYFFDSLSGGSFDPPLQLYLIFLNAPAIARSRSLTVLTRAILGGFSPSRMTRLVVGRPASHRGSLPPFGSPYLAKFVK